MDNFTRKLGNFILNYRRTIFVLGGALAVMTFSLLVGASATSNPNVVEVSATCSSSEESEEEPASSVATSEATSEIVTEVVTEVTTEVVTEVTTEITTSTPKEEPKEEPKIIQSKFEGDHYTITAEEREMLAALVYLEARGESYECQKMVLSVVFNRYDMGKGSLTQIVYAKGQFQPAPRIKSTTPRQEQYDVVDDILANGSVLPTYVLYFREGYYHKWSGHRPYSDLENTYFSYNEKDRLKVEKLSK